MTRKRDTRRTLAAQLFGARDEAVTDYALACQRLHELRGMVRKQVKEVNRLRDVAMDVGARAADLRHAAELVAGREDAADERESEDAPVLPDDTVPEEDAETDAPETGGDTAGDAGYASGVVGDDTCFAHDGEGFCCPGKGVDCPVCSPRCA